MILLMKQIAAHLSFLLQGTQTIPVKNIWKKMEKTEVSELWCMNNKKIQ